MPRRYDVAGVEGQRRNVHWLALQHESQQIEDVLADGGVIAGARELAFDGLRTAVRRQRQLGMFVRQGQERPPAAQPNLEAGRGERLDEAIACEGRRAGLQDEGAAGGGRLRRRGVEQRIDELAGGART